MLDNLFVKLLDMTITGSLVIVAVLLARLALKRMPKIFSYCLWAVVLLRLLCPVGIAVPVSGVPQAPSVSEHYTLADTDISFRNASAAALEGVRYATNLNPDTYLVQIPQKTQAEAMPAVTCSPWETWVLVGRYLWLAGVVVLAAISLVRWGKLRRKLREAVLLRENIYMVDGIATPFVAGILRPRIYIPAGLTERQQKHILLHERNHIRRLDPVWKALGYGALCLHWFNPLVWLAFFLAEQDMEMSCDEAVVQKLPGEIADYSQTLLQFSAGRTVASATPLAFGEAAVSKRIRNLSKWRQPKRLLALVTAIACGVLIVGCAADPAEMADTPSDVGSLVIPGPAAELLVDVQDENFDSSHRQYFSLPEYPDEQFLLKGASVYIGEKDDWHQIFSAHSIYLADINGDGKREFCGTITVGSGIISCPIVVYDYVDDMQYWIHCRMQSDFALRVADGRLVVEEYEHMGQFYGKQPVAFGELILRDRQISYVSGSNTIYGYRTSALFNTETLESTMTTVLDYHDRGMYLRVKPDCAANYYMEHTGVDFSPALFTEEANNSLWLDPDLTEGFEAEAKYLALLHRLTSNYYASDLLRYVYQNPNDPAQLFICTELRDCGYRDIASYYEAVITGQCQPHAETFLVRLDRRAIYRWGSEENLYAQYE